MSQFSIALLFGFYAGWYCPEENPSAFSESAELCLADWSEVTFPLIMPVDSPPPNPYSGPGDPTTWEEESPFQLSLPDNYEVEFEQDESGYGYTVHERMGDLEVRPPSYISMDEYLEWRKSHGIQDRWNDMALSRTGDQPPGILDRLNLGGPFGPGKISLNPQGTFLVDLGARINNTQNPDLPVNMQRTVTPWFDQQLQVNLVGSIAEKLRINFNFDTKSQFDFHNQLKLNYNGDEDQLLQHVGVGQVSFPLNSSLISGKQNLMGIKTAWKFGPVMLTTIASQQKGQAKSVTVQGGSQVTEFEKRADAYDANRHFFLSHFFRNQYEDALARRPMISSPVTISRMEVWITNNNSNATQESRSAIGMLDLGESEMAPVGVNPNHHGLRYNPNFQDKSSFPDNQANNLFSLLDQNPEYRAKDKVENLLRNNLNLQGGVEFEKVENMKKLSPNEFEFHPQLGYISLNINLQSTQVLFVAYEYQAKGEVYQVGEFSQDQPSNSLNSNVLFLKMLKASNANPVVTNAGGREVPFPAWDLMMKNVYSIGGYGLRQDNFRLNVYYESPTAAGTLLNLPDGSLKSKPLLQVFGLDALSTNNASQADNVFDFLEGITLKAQKGQVIFPVLEPFGSHLASQLSGQQEVEQYAFPQLYRMTPSDAVNLHPEKNRYFLKGTYQGASSSEIQLNALNVVNGSVRVTANGLTLIEGQDYTVDYSIGKVNIINPGVLSSGQEIKVSFEISPLFGQETQSLVGARVDYNLNKDVILGGTILHQAEKPQTAKLNIGNEPKANTVWTLDGQIQKESRFLTRLIDKLPFLATKEISQFTGQAEFAQLIPGHPRAIQIKGREDGIAYLDDFESAKTPYRLSSVNRWKLASFPGNNGENNLVEPGSGWNEKLASGFSRAKLAWYRIDQNLYRPNQLDQMPADEIDNHYVRPLSFQEVFQNRTVQIANAPLESMNLHYIPSERGPYNYQTDPDFIAPDGKFIDDPQILADNWAGVTYRMSGNTDFEASNIEYLEFWMLDPFIYDQNAPGGEFKIDLGWVSEDALQDGYRSMENAMPVDPNDLSSICDTCSEWARVPLRNPSTNAFANEKEARKHQDVGLDGWNDEMERIQFQEYLGEIAAEFGVNSSVYQQALNDPSGDNFSWWSTEEFDQSKAGILRRYRDFNGMEGNTPVDAVQGGRTTQGSPRPDTEDLNNNGTLNTNEQYFEYNLHFSPEKMRRGENYIVDVIPFDAPMSDGSTERVNWYQFRIPLRKGKAINGIQNFKAIEFMRMYFQGWEEEVILRMTEMQLVATSWRTYLGYMGPEVDTIPGPPAQTDFELGTVNIEENGSKTPFNYVLPPFIQRQRLIQSGAQELLQNEQSMVVKVCNLVDGDARGVYKLTHVDLRSYQNLKMWMHAETVDSAMQDWGKGDLRAFIRLGSDHSENYYEYEISLDPSSRNRGINDTLNIWREEGSFDFPIEMLIKAKAQRNLFNHPVQSRYEYLDTLSGNRIFVKGIPKISEVKTLMLGLRNFADNQGPICAEVWFNELRVTDFNEQSGQAANASLNLKLADFGNISASGSWQSAGFGGLESNIYDRSRDESLQYDLSGNFNLGKFFPKKWGIQIPLYLTYGGETSKPQFNPLESDVLTRDYLSQFPEADRELLRQSLYTQQRRRSISFNRVRKVRSTPTKGEEAAKIWPWSIENFNLSFAYSDQEFSDPNTEYRRISRHTAGIHYSYSPKPTLIEPFKKSRRKNLITGFNFYPYPKNISINLQGERNYEENRIRPVASTLSIPTTFAKNFLVDRNYALRWDLTKSLGFNFEAQNRSRIDEPLGQINPSNKDSLWDNLLSFQPKLDSNGLYQPGRDHLVNMGRNMAYSQNLGINYMLPFKLIKPLSFLSANASYQGQFRWESAADRNLDLGNTLTNGMNLQATARADLEKLYRKIPFMKRWMSPQDSLSFGQKLGRGVGNLLLSVRNVSANYSRIAGTTVSGYMPQTDNFGMDWKFKYADFQDPNGNTVQKSPFSAPGFGFVTGWEQDRSWLQKAAQNGWISPSADQYSPYQQRFSETYSGKIGIMPFKDFRIDLNFNYDRSSQYSELFRFDSLGTGDWLGQNQTETGAHSLSYIFINSAFEKNSLMPNSFRELQDLARETISERLFQAHPELASLLPTGADSVLPDGFHNGFYRKHQDVLLPAFLSAYGIARADKVELSPFPKIPLPNWSLNYNGLSKLPGFSNVFQSFSLRHSYRGSYVVSGYTRNSRWNQTTSPDQLVALEAAGNDSIYALRSEYTIPTVTIREAFSPLAGLQMNFKNGISTSLNYNKSRELQLYVANLQITETKTNDISFSFAWRKDNLNANLKIFGRNIELKNALSTRLDISIRSTQTKNRYIDGDPVVETTGGNLMLNLKPSIDYVINEKLNLRFYVDYSKNKPTLSTSFPSSFTGIGFQLRYTL